MAQPNIALAPLWYVRGGTREWWSGYAPGSGWNGELLQYVGLFGSYGSKTVGYSDSAEPQVVGYVLRFGTSLNLYNYSYVANNSGVTDRSFSISLRCLHQS